MKVQLTDEDLKERNTNYFEEGVYEVLITKAERGTTDNGKDYVEFTVQGHDDQEGTARMWFTTDKACKYTLSVLAGLAVHNKHTDAEKDKVRTAFKAITDTDQLDNKFLARFEEMDAFYRVQKSDRTYTNQAGETKHSYDKDIAAYPLKMKQLTADQLVADFKNGGTEVSTDSIPFGDS